ncbi:MAG: hypothetical protein GC155_08580 [Alphaproteobacteria bacterium]|nr:hypothetical protein [Alphaproteobacteria bacterium]
MRTSLPQHVSIYARRSILALAAGALAAGVMIGIAPPALPQAATSATASLNGDWTGVLDVQGVQLHLVLHVKTDDGATTATLDSPDQGASGIPVSSITRAGGKAAFTIDAVGSSYAGDVAPDGTSIAGTWSQNGVDLPLAFKRK